ncbi:prepilin peptidase [Sandarakinorhabdus sp. AAP62]|uniref:prepilin peptidase n=1 Tax=Sandarakinorhabdus sp. AAP62 TaxID=1248916 RepID=UPI0002E98DA4|nr:prepilin peptidase [Sandarakinorhabdus sp. AAP62]
MPGLWAAIGGGLGLLLGSFIAVLTSRWPHGETLLGRSRCDGCGQRLGAAELVPLLSHLLQRGRCRHCGVAIAARHWQIELAAAVIGAGLLWRFPGVNGLALALAGWWLLTLLILDAEHQWLPDALTLPLIPFALLLPEAPWGLPLDQRLWGAGLGFAGLWLVGLGYRRLRGRDGLGGGDPKLLAGLGALLGGWSLPFLITGAAALGLALAGWDQFRGRPVNATTRLPFGALLAGVALVLLWLGADWLEMFR